MKINNKKIIILLTVIFFGLIGGDILIDQTIITKIICLLFLVIQVIIIVKGFDKYIENNIIVIFLRIYWFMYMSMAIFYILYNKYFNENIYIWLICVLTISSICLIIGGFIANRTTRISKEKFVNPIQNWVYVTLLVVWIFMVLYIIQSNGGILSFINLGYKLKYSNESKVYSILDKLFINPFMYFNLIFVTGNNKKLTTLISRIVFIVQLIYIYISGSSIRILMMFLSLCIMIIIGEENRLNIKKLSKKQKRWILISILLIILGGILAILIRFNRENDKFNTNVLSQAYTLILTTSTFDSLYYLIKVYIELKPVYSIGQFIFPFIFFLPRNVFNFKPIELGRIIATKFMRFNENINGGFAASSMGEFYYDFGYLGIIFGMIFIGFIFSYFQKKYSIVIGERKSRLAFILALMVQSASISTSWTTMGSYILGIIIFFNIVNFMNKIRIII